MNQPVREIYADYRYKLMQVGIELNEMTLADAVAVGTVDDLLQKSERLEALVDLYAYLLASQDGGSRR